MRAPIIVSVLMLAAGLSFGEGRSVYLFPMANGLDQFLANQLIAHHLLHVTTDVKSADLVFTDRLGDSLESRLDKRDEAIAEAAKPKPAKKSDEKKEETSADDTRTIDKSGPRPGGFGRAKGTVFLVDAKSRRVVWSTYEKPRDTTADELDRAAARIATRLEKELPGK